MSVKAARRQIEEWLCRVRTTAPPGWERTRARGLALYLAARGAVGAFIVGAYFAAESAIERKGTAAPAFFTSDYLSDWRKGIIVGIVGGCVLGFWDWQMNEGAYRRAERQTPAAARQENHE